MRLVATSDTHAPFDPKLIPDGDVFVHAGDLMVDGYPDEWRARCECFAALPHKRKIYVPGNHDFHIKLYPGPALQNLRKAGVTVVGLPGNYKYNTVTLENGMVLFGIPYVVDLPRWAFNSTEEEVYAEIMKSHGDIVVSHAPIYNVLDLAHDNAHGGVKAYRDYAKYFRPQHWIHGHIHEAYGTATFLHTKVYNVCMSNRNYEHVNPPLVLDL